MDYISDYEFYQYVIAADYLKDLKRMHHIEIQHLYDDIHPTRVITNSEIGKMFSESINVEDYAIWIIDTKERHKKQQAYYQHKAAVFQNALKSLTDEERHRFDEILQHGELEISNDPLIEKLKSFIEKQIVKD